MREKDRQNGEQLSLLTDFAGRGRIKSWDGRVEIDPVEWDELLEFVGDDVHSFSTGWYDTPFFDQWGLSSGIGCFNGGEDCYDRSELNYIGEGQALAALGLTKKQTFYVVAIWKHLIHNEPPSAGTFKFTDIGWEHYNQHYSTPSHSLTPFTQLGTPMTTPLLFP